MYENFEQTLEILKTNSHFREIKNIEDKDEKFIWINNVRNCKIDY